MPEETTIQVPDNIPAGGVTVTAIEQDNYSKSVYYFDVITEHSITIQNQITDNYVENNTAIHDHIAHSPITVTVRGISGEQVFTPSAEKLNELLDNAKNQTEVSTAGKLLALTFLYPPVCNAAQNAINAWEYVKSSYNRYAGIVKSFSNSNNPLNSYLGVTSTYTETRLEEIYARLLAKRENNSEFTVETPYRATPLDHMYIQSLTLRQGEENYVTDIEITFKQLNFADVTTTNPNESVMEQYNENAKAATENCGTADGVSRDTSALYNILLK